MRLSLERLGQILDDHGMEWEYKNNGITALEYYNDGSFTRKHFRDGTQVKTLKRWLGY